jgi:hypothetical protein
MSITTQITSDKPQPVYQTFTEIQLEKNLDTSAPKPGISPQPPKHTFRRTLTRACTSHTQRTNAHPEAIGEACSVSRTGSSEVRDDGQKVSPEQLEEVSVEINFPNPGVEAELPASNIVELQVSGCVHIFICPALFV